MVTRARSPSAGRPVAGSIRWCRLAAACPPTAVAAGGGHTALDELERELSIARQDADWPGLSTSGDVASSVDEAGSDARQNGGRPVGRVALGDPAQVELDAGLELDDRRGSIDGDRAGAAGRSQARTGSICRHSLEGAVVAGSDDGVVHGRVEASQRALACGER